MHKAFTIAPSCAPPLHKICNETHTQTLKMRQTPSIYTNKSTIKTRFCKPYWIPHKEGQRSWPILHTVDFKGTLRRLRLWNGQWENDLHILCGCVTDIITSYKIGFFVLYFSQTSMNAYEQRIKAKNLIKYSTY